MPVQTRAMARRKMETESQTNKYRGFRIYGENTAVVDDFFEKLSLPCGNGSFKFSMKDIYKVPTSLHEAHLLHEQFMGLTQKFYGKVNCQMTDDLSNTVMAQFNSMYYALCKYYFADIDKVTASDNNVDSKIHSKTQLCRNVYSLTANLFPFFPNHEHHLFKTVASKALELVASGSIFALLYLAEFYPEICNLDIAPIVNTCAKGYKFESEYGYDKDPFWSKLWNKHSKILVKQLLLEEQKKR